MPMTFLLKLHMSNIYNITRQYVVWLSVLRYAQPILHCKIEKIKVFHLGLIIGLTIHKALVKDM